MAATGAAGRIEKEFGEPLRTLLPKLLVQYRTLQKVAARLQVQTGTLLYWINKFEGHYNRDTGEWDFPEEDQQAAAGNAA